MTILRLHFQVTCHKQPILAVGGHGDLLATAEHGSIRLWSYGPSHATSGGPTLLQGFPCSRQPVRALFMVPGVCGGVGYPCSVVGVFEEDGVVLFNVRGGGVVDRHVLLHPGEKKENRILTAAWNADTCTLALATAEGGVKIYDILPNHPSGATGKINRVITRDATIRHDTEKKVGQQQPVGATPIYMTGPPLSRPAVIVLRHEIVIKSVSSTPGDGSKIVGRQVSTLATSSDDRGWWGENVAASWGVEGRSGRTAASATTASGAGILVGVADGKHLCVWDLATGSTLLTALSMAPQGCTVEKVLWHGPSALVALMYHDGVGVTRVDVHQLDIGKGATVPLLSYTSDVMIAGASFTPGPPDQTTDAPRPPLLPGTAAAAARPYQHHQDHQKHGPQDPTRSLENTSSTYVHVVDRLRTLRTWLLHPGGATAVSAYSLPTAAPRVPRSVTPSSAPEASTHKQQREHLGLTHGGDSDPTADSRSPSNPVGPGSSLSLTGGSSLLSRGDHGDQTISGEGGERKRYTPQGSRRQLQSTGSRKTVDGVDAASGKQEEGEEAVNPGSLPAGALVAAVLPSRLRGPDTGGCSGILVAAGVALSGFSFLPKEREGGEGESSFLWESYETEERRGDESSRGGDGCGLIPPRVLGMRALVPRRGNQQALALVWAERPSFQVLDVSRRGRAGVVEHISLARRHREDQVETAPRTDRPCFLTSWCHSTALGILLCGWNDGTVDVVNPRTGLLSFRLQSGQHRQQQQQQQQLLPQGAACIPITAVGLIPLTLLLRHAGNQFLSDEVPEGLSSDDNPGVGGVVALIGSADGALALWPTRRTSSRPWNVILAHTDAVVAIRTAMDAPHTKLERSSGAKTVPFGIERDCPEDDDGDSSFFVVTAGANREVKVWGIDTAERQDIPPLTLAGYTVVGSGSGDVGGVKAGGGSSGSNVNRLTALELLSERHMACGFDSGAVEVWSIPFASRGGVLASTRQAAQAFPQAHGGKITSIVVSIGIVFRGQAGAGVKAGRVVLTTSVDRTVVRWVSMDPGDSIQPLNRYCLSEETAAAVLLPPPVPTALFSPTAAGRHAGGPPPPKKLAKVGVEVARSSTVGAAATTSTPNTSTLFRVVAALNGAVTVLELATIETLMGEGAGSAGGQLQRLCPAVANAIPGTPLIARLPPRPFAFGSRSEQNRTRDDGAFRWRVGGPRGREAGWYDVLGGIKESLAGWEAAGKRRMALTAGSRNAWLAHAGGTIDKGVAAARVDEFGGDDRYDVPLQAASSGPQPETSESARRRGQGGGRRAVKSHRSLCVRRRPTTVKPSEKMLTVCRATQDPGGKRVGTSQVARNHDLSASTAPEHAYRKVRGGKTIKVDPGFARAAAEAAAEAAWERLWLQHPPTEDGASDDVPPQVIGGAELYGNRMYSMEMTVPEVSRRLKVDVSKRGNGEFSGIAISFQGQPTGSLNDSECYSSRFKHSPSSPPTVTGWPPPSTKAESVTPGLGMSVSELHDQPQLTAGATESNTSDLATPANFSLVEGEGFVPMVTKTAEELHPGGGGGGGGGSGDSGSSAATSRLVRGATIGIRGRGEDDKARAGGERAAANSVRSDATATEKPRAIDAEGYDDDNGHHKKGLVGPMNAVVAATAAARRARDAWDARGRMKTPMLIERRPPSSMNEPRLPFNFDSAQAPSCGMSGVGVAVPRGYADERLRAAKRSFTPSLPLRKLARRRVNAKNKAHGDGVSSEERGSASFETGYGEGQNGPETAAARRTEVFPTGLVVSTHFRESSTGREILMLEVEKAADRRNIYPGGARDQCRPPAFGDNAAIGASDAGIDETAAAPAAAAELAYLSPRSKGLQAIFESLAAGRDVLTQEALVKWDYVARSIERGLVSQYQVRSLFRQAHGGRHKGKMVWEDMVAFYEEMESALDKACAPPLVEDFVVDSEEWDAVSVSLYLTKRGEVYVVALEAAIGDGSGDPPPSPTTVRRGEEIGSGGGQGRRVVASWGMATVANPDVPARITLSGLLPERHYELYAYGENGVGGRLGKSDSNSRAGGFGDGSGCDAETGDANCMFSVEQAPSGMSAELVAATRLASTTAQEPDEDLDVPWKDLSEPEQMTEALAALADPLVARAAREAALDPPTAEDLTPGRCDADPVSRNKWRSFCRWWPTAVSGGGSGVAAGGAAGGGSERSAFLLRECVFAAQQPEILEEAAMMGVQILEGDWNAEVTAIGASGKDTNKAKTPSARQRRWTAFRSWYRGGRVFDRADQTLIAAAMLRRPPSPGSQGRPLTPRLTPADGPQPAAPFPTDVDGEETATALPIADVAAATKSTGIRHVSATAAAPSKEGNFSEAAERVVHGPEAGPVTSPAGMMLGRRTTPPAPPAPPGAGATLHVTLLKSDQPAPARTSNNGGGDGGGAHQTEGAPGELRVQEELARDTDAAQLAGIEGWGAEEREGDDTFAVVSGEVEVSKFEPGADSSGGGGDGDLRVGGKIAEGLPPVSREGGTATAKRLRMEARRKFLAARTTSSKQAAQKVGRLLDVKREDVKAKRAAEAASGVMARRGRAAAAKKKRRRSQVEKALALKRADELLEESGKAEDLRQRRGSLGTLRPEDVASIGVFDTFDVDEFDPEEVDPELFRHRSSATSDADDTINGSLEKEAAAWAPRSPGELTLELQLACVHPRVCNLAASARIGVPDPEDAFSPLSNKKARWTKFSAWYYNPEATRVSPHRKAFLEGEVTAAMGDEIVRLGMESEGMLEEEGGDDVNGCRGCDVSDFLDWYCEEGAAPRQDFRRRRVEELLQSRRHAALQLLAYVPTPFLFRDLPRPIPPPPPPMVERFRLFPSRSPEAFSWEDVSKWYGEEALEDEDEALRNGERAGQRAALLEVAKEEEGENQSLEQRVARWEDFRSALMRAAAAELRSDPFRVGEGEWQYSATLLSWRELRHLGFDTGSGLENKDEIHDALEVAQKEAQDERERVAEVRRQREIAKQKRLEEERRRREEEDRLRWMRETEERRRLVQQHMANLKRQRALDAERASMAKEEALALALAREEKKLVLAHQAREAAKAKEFRLLKMAAAAVADMEEMVKKRLDAETEAMTLEDHRSREVEFEILAAEAVMRDREAYLRELYTPFVPLWADLWEKEEEEEEEEEEGWSKHFGFQPTKCDKVVSVAGQEGRAQRAEEGEVVEGGGGGDNDVDLTQASDGYKSIDISSSGSIKQRPTMWWRGADAPHIWKGPPTSKAAAAKCRRACSTNGKLAPGARFVPAEWALLDDLEPQTISVGRLSREYLALLGLPYESVRDMFEKDSWTVKNGDAMVDEIQLGRVFTMFEKDEVRDHLVPIAATIEGLSKSRQRSRTAGVECTGARGGERRGEGRDTASLSPLLDGSRLRPQTLAKVSREGAGCFPWSTRGVGGNDNPFPPAPRQGIPPSTGGEAMEEEREARWRMNSNYSYYHHSPPPNEQRSLAGLHTSQSSIPATCGSSGGRNASGGRDCGAGSIGEGVGYSRGQVIAKGGCGNGGVWPGQEGARQVVHAGVEAIAGLPLSGDERGDSATPKQATVVTTSGAAVNAAGAQPLARSSTTATLPRGRVRRRPRGRPTTSPVVSPPPAEATNATKNERRCRRRRRRRQPPFTWGGESSSTRFPGSVGERADTPTSPRIKAAPGAEATAATTSPTSARLVREKVGTPDPDFGARSTPLIPMSQKARGPGLVMSQEGGASPCRNPQQWGGFGPGHVPKYFRGRFGVAGEKKALVRRLIGDGLGEHEGGNDDSN